MVYWSTMLLQRSFPSLAFFHSSWLLFLFISSHQLAFTFKDPYTLLLVLFSFQRSTLTPEQSTVPASAHYLPTLYSLETLCHICEKVSVKHYVAAPQPVPRITFWPKKNLTTDMLELGSSGCLWCPFVKANFTRQNMCNIRNLEKHTMKSLPKVTRNRLRYADPQHLI